MNCPIDETTLVISSRDGIEIDYCPQCRGVWLDRGELDKIIERSAPAVAPVAPVAAPPRRDDRYDDRPRYDDDRRYDERSHKKRRRASFLEDLFDFD
ncbi:MAG TPA: zf-TFIIB domain-containing protein [Acidimicrobiales bacterium]|nr:zf-TFIIB domain-containing protein [Acidimicrobiales bacterium]